VADSTGSPTPRQRAVREIILFGISGGILLALLRITEYRFLVVEHSVAVYTVLLAALFAGVGIWIGVTLRRRKPPVTNIVHVITREVPVEGPFVRDDARVDELGITPRELEILGLIADGLSNREIAERLSVSENTVKTHSGRLFDKLGAKRRTQAVHVGKASRLIP
jgi:NarL family two-component system response regulator LiaR